MKGYYNQTLSNRRLNHVHPLVLFLVVSSCRSSVRGAYKRTLPVTTMFQRGVGCTVQATSRKSLSKSIAQLDLTRSRRFSLSQRSLKVAAESVLRRFAADAYKSSPFLALALYLCCYDNTSRKFDSCRRRLRFRRHARKVRAWLRVRKDSTNRQSPAGASG